MFATMAVRAIGTSTIAFGLVSLPVKIYSAAESSRKVSFNMIWKERGVRVRQQYIDPADGTVVPREEIVKGYEFAKDQYVLFTEEELKVVEAPKSDEIEIVSFVPADTVGRLYFNKAYYLGPDKGGARAYRLLSSALQQTNRVAIAKHATRGKQHLVMVRPHEDGLLMEQLYYADEIRAFDEVPLEEGDVNEAELGLAVQLIDQAASEAFDPREVQRRSPREDPRAHPAEGRWSRDHGRPGRGVQDSDHRSYGGPQGLDPGRRGGAEASRPCRKEDECQEAGRKEKVDAQESRVRLTRPPPTRG